ncbi:MAG: hypothetical protein AAF081_13415 [Actinomycetota bacterium]
MNDDELRSRMSGLADTTAIDTVTLEQVEARSRRRTLQQRGLTVLAAFALVVGGTIGVVALGNTGDDLDVAADDADATDTDSTESTDGAEGEDETSDGPDETDAEVTQELDADATATTLGPDAVTVARDDAAFFEGEYYGGPNRVVAWNGGFLAFGERFVPAEPVELTFDGSDPISDYFPPEILDTLSEAGVSTIDEAMAVLEEAGLMQQATDIVTQNPEVLEWYNSVFSGGRSESFVEFSEDGETWTEVGDFAWPGGLSYAPQVASNGTQLVAVVNDVQWDAETGRTTGQEITVHITDDLRTWTEVQIPLSLPTVADYVHLEISPNQIVVTDDGWYLTVGTWQWIDLWSALPTDVLDEMATNGWDWRPTEAGIEILEWNWEEFEATTPTILPAPDEAEADLAYEEYWEEPEPTVIRVVPWSELPFGYDEWDAAQFENSSMQGFVGDFAGGVAPADTPSASNDARVIAADGELFALVSTYPVFDESTDFDIDYQVTVTAFRSADGRSWTPVALPDFGDDVWVDSAIGVDGGILLVVTGDFRGQRFYLGTSDGGFVPVDGPDLGETYIWFNPATTTGDGVATVVDLGQQIYPEFVAYSVSFEYDGFEISSSQDGEGQATFIVVDLATGETVYEFVGDVYSEVPFVYGEQGLVVLDDDRETIVEIPFEIAEQEIFRAESEAWDAAYAADPYVPDFRVVATRDGRTWIIQPLPAPTEEYGWYGDALVADGRVLVSDGNGGWASIELP